jgi:uncharacterized membrane protein YesL
MQKMTTITNLIILNALWIICSIPIITMGAATTAMYSVLFAYRRQETDSVLKPFFSAFKKNFRRSTLCWIVLLVLILALAYDAIVLIFGAEMQLFLCIPVIIIGLMVVITVVYIFPQIALFENKTIPMIKNGFLLFVLYPLQSIAVIILTLLPLILLLFIPQLFWFSILLWTLIGISLCAKINCFLLSKIFERYIPKSEEETTEETEEN